MPPTTPVLDDFNRANGDVGADWSMTFGSTANRVSSNQLIGRASDGALVMMGWNVTEWLDAEVYYDIPTIGNTFSQAVCMARIQPATLAAPDAYVGRMTSAPSLQILRMIAGSTTQIGADITTPNVQQDGDTIWMVVTGVNPVIISFYCRVSAGSFVLLGSRSDSDSARIQTQGYIGMGTQNDTPTYSWVFDNFGGGSVGSFRFDYSQFPKRFMREAAAKP